MISSKDEFQSRISYLGDLKPLFAQVCQDYGIGSYLNHRIIRVGYEDFNVAVTTDKNNYFFKFFSDLKGLDICRRYVNIIQRVLKAGVNHPRLHRSPQGPLYVKTLGKAKIRLVVLDYIGGRTFYDLKVRPTEKEIKDIIRQAAKINKIDFSPPFFYDEWAVANFLDEYRKKGKYLEQCDIKSLRSVYENFSKINLDKLPHCFVHGDIINTNVIKDNSGKLYIVDYSVANIYPRIQELAVMLCDLFFDKEHKQNFSKTFDLVLNEYQTINPLTPDEIRTLPTFIQTAHAMHILITNYEKVVKNNDSEENRFYQSEGREGLAFTFIPTAADISFITRSRITNNASKHYKY